MQTSLTHTHLPLLHPRSHKSAACNILFICVCTDQCYWRGCVPTNLWSSSYATSDLWLISVTAVHGRAAGTWPENPIDHLTTQGNKTVNFPSQLILDILLYLCYIVCYASLDLANKSKWRKCTSSVNLSKSNDSGQQKQDSFNYFSVCSDGFWRNLFGFSGY